MNDILNLGIQVTLKQPDDFLKIRETLTRMGVASSKDNTLYQSTHILHKRGNYYIMHFKEMFILDGRESTLDSDDIARRNLIASLLEQWGLLKVNHPEYLEPKASSSAIKVVPHKDKINWELRSKYSIGVKH